MMEALELGNYCIYKTYKINTIESGGAYSYNKVIVKLKKVDLEEHKNSIIFKGSYLKFKRICSNRNCIGVSFHEKAFCPFCKSKKVLSKTLLNIGDRIILRDNDLRVEVPMEITNVLSCNQRELKLEVKIHDSSTG